MKQTFILLIMSFIITACTYRVAVREDPYRRVQTVTMYLGHPIREYKYPVIHLDEGRYYREVVRGRPAPTTVTFRFEAVPDMENFSDRAYIMVDGKSYLLKIIESDTKTRTAIGRYPRYSRNRGRYERTVPAGDSITAAPVKTMTARCSINTVIERRILKAETMSYRFYTGTEPVTLDVGPKQLEAIRKFLKAGRS